MNKQKLVFATNNAHKLQEVSAILGDKIELCSLRELGCREEIPETADSMEGNALQKAAFIYNRYGMDCFADDSGLEVDALHGEPGIFSARYALLAEHALHASGIPAHTPPISEFNIQKLLRKMEGITNRKAQFRTVIALITHGEKHFFEGIICGEIITERKGSNGFGYDPVFIPEGYQETFAELPAAIKNKISHRAISVSKLRDFLTTHS